MKTRNLPCLSASVLSVAALTPALAQAQGATGKYNVVFVISDQHKASVNGCYGDTIVKTPNIDALARTGVRFTRMYTPSPLSAPARAALMTGTYPSTNGALFHQMLAPDKKGNIKRWEAGKLRLGYSEELEPWGVTAQRMGYRTAAIGKVHVHGELQKGVNEEYPQGNSMGFDVSDLRFYTYFPGAHYRDYKHDPDYYNRYREIGEYAKLRKGNQFNQQMLPTLLENDEDIFDFIAARRSNAFIDECLTAKKPFFIHVGLEKPHKPWSTSQRFYDLYDASQMPLPATWRDWHDNGAYPYVRKGTHCPLTDTVEIKQTMVAYYGCVSETDEALGEIMDNLKRQGVYDQTIIIYTTDHGEHLFEHGLHEKHNMFEDAVNVPFIISCPALLPQGAVCESPASLIDVLPTLSELLGGEPFPQWEGRSLVGQIEGAPRWDRRIFSEFYQEGFDLAFPGANIPVRMLLDNRYKYVYTHGMIDQLYDTQADPDEMHNLAIDPAYASLTERYRLLTLDKWVFGLYPQMNGRITARKVNSVLNWEAVPMARSYCIWMSDTPDAADARKVGTTQELAYTIPAEKAAAWFWVTADWDLTHKGPRKEAIPMITESLPPVLPVTPALHATR